MSKVSNLWDNSWTKFCETIKSHAESESAKHQYPRTNECVAVPIYIYLCSVPNRVYRRDEGWFTIPFTIQCEVRAVTRQHPVHDAKPLSHWTTDLRSLKAYIATEAFHNSKMFRKFQSIAISAFTPSLWYWAIFYCVNTNILIILFYWDTASSALKEHSNLLLTGVAEPRGRRLERLR